MPKQDAKGFFSLLTSLAAAMLLLAGCASYPHAYEADKVTICHKDKKTLVLPASAVDAHLAHGDYRGPCE